MEQTSEKNAVEKWWIGLTYIAGGAVAAAAFGITDQDARRAILEMALGGFLIGISEWISRPITNDVKTDELGRRWKITGYPRRFVLVPFALELAGAFLVGRAALALFF